MQQRYKIKEIVHSGRKDTRNTPVSNSKYDGLIGSVIDFDIDTLKPFEPMKWKFVDNPHYDTWQTSVTLEAWVDDVTGDFGVETANSIYKFEKFGKNNNE